MKIFVTGATGRTGQEIVTQALAAGHEVVALVRSKAKAESLLPEAALMEGDGRDAAVLRRALKGCDAVISALGTRKMTIFKKVTVNSESTRTLVDAMKTEGVSRFVCITGLGAGDSAGHGGFLYDYVIKPLFLRTIYLDKDRQEDIIGKSGLDWTIVRPTVLTDKPSTGHIRAMTDLTGLNGGSIPRADVAAFLLEELRSRRWIHKAPLITTAK